MDAPGRHLRAKVVSIDHLRRRPWGKLTRSDWTLRSGFSRRTGPGARLGLAGEAGRESEGDEQQRSALICMRLGSARPSNPRQLMLAKEGNHSFAPRTQRTFRLVSSEDELHLHGLLRMVV